MNRLILSVGVIALSWLAGLGGLKCTHNKAEITIGLTEDSYQYTLICKKSARKGDCRRLWEQGCKLEFN